MNKQTWKSKDRRGIAECGARTRPNRFLEKPHIFLIENIVS
jgi:hypothetical protein